MSKSIERTLKWELRHPTKTIWRRARYRAVKNQIPFEILTEDISIPKFCPVLGIELKINKGGRSGYYPDSPSLDKIQPKLGYTCDNIRVISSRANRLKCDATKDELEKLLVDARSFGY